MVNKKVKHKKINITFAVVHINLTFNNTIINVSDQQGNTLIVGSSGMKFRGAKKSTAYAAQVIFEQRIFPKAQELGIKTVDILVEGPGQQRENLLLSIVSKFNVRRIIDNTKLPHNGCRPPKRRRV